MTTGRIHLDGFIGSVIIKEVYSYRNINRSIRCMKVYKMIDWIYIYI